MLNMIKEVWKGRIEVNGQDVTVFPGITGSGPVHIKLYPQQNTSACAANNPVCATDNSQKFVITVKQYMTRKSTPEFDFMSRWNNDVPMPLRTMVGTVVKETRGMVYMKLHGDVYAEKICTCMKCGRVITNPVSQFFGMGPECGGHNYVNPFNTQEELRLAVDAYKKKLQETVWEGWVIKSAITEQKEVQ